VPSADPTQRFSDRVNNYEAYRPRYPDAFFTFLEAELGIGPATVVADVGSGTGISAGPLVERGVVVHAIEPNGPMRAAAEAKYANRPNFHSLSATAEATGLPDDSVDLVLAAQAFHWFDKPRARAEFARILRPGGRVVLVWNERKLAGTPFLAAYENLLLTYATDYTKIRHELVTEDVLAAFFAGPFETRVFANVQEFDCAGLEGRLLSSSYAPAAGQAGHDEMLIELRRIFDAHQQGGRVRVEYDTRARVGRVK